MPEPPVRRETVEEDVKRFSGCVLVGRLYPCDPRCSNRLCVVGRPVDRLRDPEPEEEESNAED